MATAVDAVTLPPTLALFGTHTLGSGQGIAHTYARWEKGLGGIRSITRYADSAVFSVEEVDHLVGLSSQAGSTLLAELRRLYMGEKLGHLFVDPTKRMPIEAHTYRAGLIVGIQPTRAGVLLNDADGGTPQRFLWLPATYLHPDARLLEPAPWRWIPPDLPQDAPPVPIDTPGMPTASQTTLAVCESACRAIDASALARSKGEGDPLDGHALLCREKVAAALGILNGRAEVAESDWELAGIVMGMSNTTRQHVIDTLTQQSRNQNMMKAVAEADRTIIIDERISVAAVQRVADRIAHTLPATGWVAHSALRRTFHKRDRGAFDAAIEHLIALGQIAKEDTGQGGTRYGRTGTA